MVYDEPGERYGSGEDWRSWMSGAALLNYILSIEELWKMSLPMPLEQLYFQRICKSEYLNESLLPFGKHWEVFALCILIIAIHL